MSRIVSIIDYKNTTNHATMSCTKTGQSEDETNTAAPHPHKRELKQVVCKNVILTFVFLLVLLYELIMTSTFYTMT
jgi:hypothetical protein